MSWKTGRGDSAPSLPPAPRYRVVIPKPGDPLICRVLDHTYTGVDCHWLRGSGATPSRTIGCIKGSGCMCENVPLPYKWHGYLGVSLYQRSECVIVSLTDRGRLALEAVAGDSESLRGLKLSLKRATDHPSSRLLIYVLAEQTIPAVPPPFDLMPSLAALYGPAWAEHFLAHNRGKDGAA